MIDSTGQSTGPSFLPRPALACDGLLRVATGRLETQHNLPHLCVQAVNSQSAGPVAVGQDVGRRAGRAAAQRGSRQRLQITWQPTHDGRTDFPFCLRSGVGQCQPSSGLVRIRPTSDDDGLTDELDNRFLSNLLQKFFNFSVQIFVRPSVSFCGNSNKCISHPIISTQLVPYWLSWWPATESMRSVPPLACTSTKAVFPEMPSRSKWEMMQSGPDSLASWSAPCQTRPPLQRLQQRGGPLPFPLSLL